MVVSLIRNTGKVKTSGYFWQVIAAKIPLSGRAFEQ
jgi:hypothetical protein